MSAIPTSVDFGAVTTDTTANEMVTLTHTGAATDPAVMIQSATITGTDAGQFSHDLTSAPIYVFPGDTVDVDLSFTPTSVSGKTATFEVTHNGTASPLKLP